MAAEITRLELSGLVTQSHTDRFGRGEPKVTTIPGDRLASDSYPKMHDSGYRPRRSLEIKLASR